MDRRAFLRSSCAACLATAAGGGMLSGIAGCASSNVYRATVVKNIIQIDSALLATKQTLVVRTDETPFDILLVKRSETDYEALLMECTHQNNALTASSTGLFCPAHGSAFDLDGCVIRGPAARPLKKYKTTVSGNIINIDLAS
jgi:Rieske Fe-S protein